MTAIKLACLDLAGTAIGDIATVERAFADAIATQGIVPGTGAYARAMVHVHRSRGLPKIEIFRGIFPENEAQAQAANLTFERSYEGTIDRTGLQPMPGVVEVFEKLRAAGLKVALFTGFSRRTLTRVLQALSWNDKIDLAVSPEDVPRGCPWPDMILHAAHRLGISDPCQIALAGDSESDMLCGTRAGASVIAGVMSGPHSRDRLLQGGATHLMGSVTDFPTIIFGRSEASTCPNS